MAIQIFYYSVVIQFRSVGGYQYLNSLKNKRLGTKVWYDKHIIVDNWMMDYNSVEYFINHYSELGLNPLSNGPKKARWKDICVVTSHNGICDYPCDWLHYTKDSNSVKSDEGDDLIILTDQKMENPADCIIISGQVDSNPDFEAGHFCLDNFIRAFNYGIDGNFELKIPCNKVEQLNRHGDLHRLTVENYITGNSSDIEFQLGNKPEVELGLITNGTTTSSKS